MSAETTATTNKNEALKNISFYARVDTTSNGRTYKIFVKGNGDELSMGQKCWMAIKKFFTKADYLLDLSAIDISVDKDLSEAEKVDTNNFGLKIKKPILNVTMDTKELKNREFNLFRKNSTSAKRFSSIGGGKFGETFFNIEDQLNKDGLDD